MKNPIERLVDSLIQGDPQKAALIVSGKNRRYFTSFPSSAGFLLITAEKAYLVLDSRYSEAGAKKAQYCEVLGYKDLAETLGGLIKKHALKSIHLETSLITVADARRFEKIFSDNGAQAVLDEALDNAIISQRILKSPEEIAKIEAAQAITDATFTHMLDFIKEGMTEKEIALEIEFFMRKNGASGLAFGSIVAAGPQSSMPHAVPSDYQVQKGDFITMDTGAALDGYNSDMTRTIALGHVSDEQREVYETVLKAHLDAMAAVKPGAICKDVDKIARDLLDSKYPGCFGHGLGHGVGMDIHEWPRFAPSDSTPCEAGMVITDEPGVYLPGRFGVRIEDMVLVTEDGHVSLTHSPKELIEI